MPRVLIDKIESLSCKEVRGVIRSMSRKVRVIFTGPEIAAARDNGDVLLLALNACDSVGLTAWSLPNITFTDPRQAVTGALTLISRSPSVAENDPTCVDVILEYEHIVEAHNQKALPAKANILFGKGKTSIVEKSTNFFYPFGIKTDANNKDTKTQILVSYKYSINETSVSALGGDPRYPRRRFQGGTINIPFPQANYQLSLVIPTNNPAGIAWGLIAKINLNQWMGMRELTWLCSEVSWEVNSPVVGVNGPTYKFGFEFQYNDDGWDPTVVFSDQRLESKIPAGVMDQKATGNDTNGVLRLIKDNTTLVLGNPEEDVPAAMWDVPALARVDFNAYFNSLFEGIDPPLLR